MDFLEKPVSYKSKMEKFNPITHFRNILVCSEKKPQYRFPSATLRRSKFSETEIFGLWYLGQTLNLCACNALMEAFFAFTGIRLEAGRCDPSYWNTLTCHNERASDIVTSLFKCVSTCSDSVKYLGLFSGNFKGLKPGMLVILDEEQIFGMLHYVFSTDGRAKNEVHLKQVAEMDNLKHGAVLDRFKCKHSSGPMAPISRVVYERATPDKSTTKAEKITPLLSVKDSPSGSGAVPVFQVPKITGLDDMDEETRKILGMSEEDVKALEEEEERTRRPASILGDYLRFTMLTFLSEEGAVALLNKYSFGWQKDTEGMSERERYGTMDYMCRTMILEQLQYEDYDKERVQIAWPERRTAIQEITEGVSKKLRIDQPVMDMIIKTYNMSKVIYTKLVSEGQVTSELHGGEPIYPTPPPPAQVEQVDTPAIQLVRPPYKPGHAIVKAGSGYMYVKL